MTKRIFIVFGHHYYKSGTSFNEAVREEFIKTAKELGHEIDLINVYEEKQINSAKEVLRSGKVNYWTGNKCKAFENDFAKYVGTKYSIAVANGSLALSLAYIACGIGNGDEVITTPRSFVATAGSISLLQAIPVFADVDIDSGNITADSIEKVITKKTKAIVCLLYTSPSPRDS